MLISWLFWGVVALVIIALLMKVPGIDIALKPVGILLQDLVKWVGATGGGYLVFLIKSFFRYHFIIFHHLTHSEETYDVELKVKKEGDT